QVVNLDGVFGFQSVIFPGFTNLKSVKWGWGNDPNGFDSYHQFDNVSVTAGGSSTFTGMDFGTVNKAPPDITVSDVTIAEANSGYRLATVSLPTPRFADYPITVYYTTSDGTATVGSDYGNLSGPGPVQGYTTIRTDSGSISIPVFGDTAIEP